MGVMAVTVSGDKDGAPAMPREPSGSLAVGAIPREPPGFQPRADLLAELDEAAAGALAPCSVTGVPGAGTTQLAAAYARATLAQGARLVAWVSGTAGPPLARGGRGALPARVR